MSEFKKGQLVAVRDSDDCEWRLRIYDHERGGQHFCLAPEHELSQAMWWAQVCPAEFIWPNIFLSVDREVANGLRRQRDFHYRRIKWLCGQLQAIGDRNGTQECPPVPHGDCRTGSCADCWEVASLKAVEEIHE